MNMSNEFTYQENLLVSKHLVERCKNAASDVKDWCQLRIQHREEIQAVGLLHFNGWREQRDNIAQLSSFHFKKHTMLLERQRKEYENINN